MKNINVKFLTESAIIAAIYAVITMVFAPISYDAIQFRIAEALVLLVVLNHKYAFALIIGCFVANTTSSLGWYDMLFGTFATLLSVICMRFTKSMLIAGIFPVIFNAVIVSIELGIAFDLWGYEFFYNMGTIALGEFVVIYFIGIPLMRALLKNESLSYTMELNNNYKNVNVFNEYQLLALSFSLLLIILFFAYPMAEGLTIFNIANNNKYYLYIALFFYIAFFIILMIKKKKLSLILSIIDIILIFSIYILIGILENNSFKYVYYYLYILFLIPLILITIRNYKHILNYDNLI